jgi:hypothetical protein
MRLTLASAVQDALDPLRQGLPGTLRSGLVGGFAGLADPDGEVQPLTVLYRGSSPAPFRCIHGLIMYQQIIVDNPPVRVFNVPTLNTEVQMKAHYKVKEARNAAKALIAKKLDELRVEMKAALAAGDTKRYGTLMVEFVSFGGMD